MFLLQCLTLKQILDAQSSILKRLSDLEGGSSARRPRRNPSQYLGGMTFRNRNRATGNMSSGGQGRGAGASTTAPYRRERVITENTHFGELVRSLFQGSQVRHHSQNWGDLPGKLDRSINELFQGITPPMTDDQLRSNIDALCANLKSDLVVTIQEHLQRQLCNVQDKLSKLDPTDVEKAAHLAETKLVARLNRADRSRVQQWLREDSALVGHMRARKSNDGSNAKRSTGLGQAQQPIPTSNTFDVLASLTDEDFPPLGCTPQPGPSRPRVTRRPPAEDGAQRSTPAGKRNRDNLNNTNSTNDSINTSPLICTQIEMKQRTDEAGECSNNNINNTVVVVEEDRTEAADCSSLPSTWSPPDNSTTMITPARSTMTSASQPTSGSPLRQPKINSGPKNAWRLDIRRSAKTVIIADSNMREAESNDPTVDIQVYPGANLNHVAAMLRLAKFPPSVKEVVIAAGINNRDWSSKGIQSSLSMVHSALARTQLSGHFVGVSISETAGLTTEQISNIKLLNDTARSRFKQNYIPALEPNLVQIREGDFYNIHHTKTTLDLIVQSIINHLN